MNVSFLALLELPSGQDTQQMLYSYENLQLEFVIKWKCKDKKKFFCFRIWNKELLLQNIQMRIEINRETERVSLYHMLSCAPKHFCFTLLLPLEVVTKAMDCGSFLLQHNGFFSTNKKKLPSFICWVIIFQNTLFFHFKIGLKF